MINKRFFIFMDIEYIDKCKLLDNEFMGIRSNRLNNMDKIK